MTTYPGEIWLPVTNYEEFYAVSDQGRIKRLKRRKGPLGKSWPFLEPVRQKKSGHLVVSLYRDGRRELRKVHQLVLETFTGSRPEGMLTRHLNGNPADNRLVNLTYGTYGQNLQDDLRNGVLRNGGKIKCLRGHDYTAGNTYVNPRDGNRSCKICRRAAFQAWKERNA